MNKRNLSITLSVFIAAFVITIMIYSNFSQIIERYDSAKISMPEDILVYRPLKQDKIREIRDLENVKAVGLKEEPKSVKLGKEILNFTKYNQAYFSMQHKFLEEGSLPDSEDQIVVSEKTRQDLGLKLGDKISLKFGQRIFNDEVVNPEENYRIGESFKSDSIREYKLVGVYKTRNFSSNQRVISYIGKVEGKYYPCIEVDKLEKTYETRDIISECINKNSHETTLVIPNEASLNFFYIDRQGSNTIKFLVTTFLVPVALILVFLFMIRNIFNVWAIYKLRELSMYKSIGATTGQIYGLLLKDSMKISFLPLLLGEVSGLLLMKLIFDKVITRGADLYGISQGGFSFHWGLVLGIILILLFILIVAVSFPARMVGKIEILEGIKENTTIRDYKKKKAKDLFKELKVNNRKILRPALIVLTAGLIILESMFGVVNFHNYNRARANHYKDFNVKVSYNTRGNVYPQVFDKIRKEVKPIASIITVENYILVDSSYLKYSQDFQRIGFDKRLEGAVFYPGSDLIYGKVIGVEDKEFHKISQNKGDLILVNQVQKDIKEFYPEATFIPYLDNDLSKVKFRYEKDFDSLELPIDGHIYNLGKNLDEMDLYEVRFLTSLDHFSQLLEEAENQYNQNSLDLPSLYYNLEMKFDNKDLDVVSKKIDEIMVEQVDANEKYKIDNMDKDREFQEIQDRGVYLLLWLVTIAAVVLNIANAYSSTNLSFFNRRKEIGILLSNGMSKDQVEEMLKKEVRGSIVFSLTVSILVSIGLVAYLLYSVAYMDLRRFLEIMPYQLLIPLIFLTCLSTYGIYISAMKKVTEQDVIGLIK